MKKFEEAAMRSMDPALSIDDQLAATGEALDLAKQLNDANAAEIARIWAEIGGDTPPTSP